MTQEQFIAKFRGRMLLFVSEAWAIRKENTTSLGMLMDGHNIEALRLMNMQSPAKLVMALGSMVTYSIVRLFV